MCVCVCVCVCVSVCVYVCERERESVRVSEYVCVVAVDEGAETEPPAKKKTRGKAPAEATKATVSKVTNWSSIGWSELGQTTDAR